MTQRLDKLSTMFLCTTNNKDSLMLLMFLCTTVNTTYGLNVFVYY